MILLCRLLPPLSFIHTSRGQYHLVPYRVRYWERRSAVINAIIEQAITRHELQASPDPTLMMEFMTGPILARPLISGQPLTQDFAATIVDNLLRCVVNTSTSLAESTPPAPF